MQTAGCVCLHQDVQNTIPLANTSLAVCTLSHSTVAFSFGPLYNVSFSIFDVRDFAVEDGIE